MKTHHSTRVVSLSLVTFATALAACSGPPRADRTSTATTGESASAVESAPLAHEPSYVLIDEAPGGYTVTTLNAATKTHVNALVLSGVDIDTPSLASALATPGTLAAQGTFRDDGKEFGVTALYRALPDVAPPADATYFVASTEADAGDSAASVNLDTATPFELLDVSAALAPHVSASWVSQRVLDGGALVAGSIASGVLHASAVFVRVPEVVTCEKPAAQACEPGTEATFARDASRCLVAAGCEHRAMCPLDVVSCEHGYVRASWPGPGGCPSSACDPAFDPAP